MTSDKVKYWWEFDLLGYSINLEILRKDEPVFDVFKWNYRTANLEVIIGRLRLLISNERYYKR